MKIKVTQKGNGFDKLEVYLKRAPKKVHQIDFDSYGQRGVDALRKMTPVDTGKTAASWNYRVVRRGKRTSIEWYNTNAAGKVSVAILLQYGHATGSGGYVVGQDYINPALKPVFDEIVKEIEREVNS